MFDNTESGLLTDDGEFVTTTTTDKVDFTAQAQSAEALTTIIESEPEPETLNKWALRDRLRSKVLWAAVVGCIMTVFSALHLWDKIGITADGFSEIVAAVGTVLAAFGVFNDPTNREGF